ncbi:peptidylprolyl isomerase [Rhodohalobacter sulfatireducens]|uniref:peptidylprolyl isomerase n=1 Tax=Rhodohalobacter sulfatireducens TaxID=2911366 RepID=A0ABS9KH50_9BACT|nr:peptidylprolyl isomerase [Rhodohalobacter sulfatireducens]MCG2590184.1 peptidylprolyl isomerase [Rhodohalobacter sulfatireducens]
MNFFFHQRYKGFFFLLFLVPFFSCTKQAEQDRKPIILTEYPNLANETLERDYDGLRAFANYENEQIRSLAWNGIRKSEAKDLQSFVNYAVQQDDSLIWYSISSHLLNKAQVDSIGQHFENGWIKSEAVCEVFFKHGTINTLDILLGKPELLLQNEVCAKSVGGIVAGVQVEDSSKKKIIELAFHSEDETIWRNLLYGFYRSELNRPNPESELHVYFNELLDERDGFFSYEMDQYVTRILGKVGFLHVMERRSDRELNQAVQLSNELARNIAKFEHSALNHRHIKRLLNHTIDNVVAQSLQAFQEFDSIPEQLLDMIEFEIAPITRDAEVFAEALTVLVTNERDIEGYRNKLDFMDSENEYLKQKILPLYAEIESDEQYLDRLQSEIRDGGIGGLRATEALMNYFTEHSQNQDAADEVRSLTLHALEEGDRSVISTIGPLLNSTVLFDEDSFEWMFNQYQDFVEMSEWENEEVLEEVLSNRFPDQFEALEISEKPFRIPNWERLYEMGTNPFWVLETEKGTIEIQLDPLAAPFTVSSIDSLTRTGVYDGVPFHRVVRNFVIQGGDIERKDGYGGLEYRIPTEPSFKSFERGMVGIASAGTDTEGSQFFIMLNWSPHLDGNYTIFGKVTKGTDVADRIQMGDKLIEASIYSR